MEDIFDLDSVPEMENHKIEALQYAKDSKVVFEKMMLAFSGNHYSRCITEEEYAIAPCDNCKGCGSFIFNENKVECVADNEQGECYEKCFDYEAFYEEIVNEIMFGKTTNYFDLYSSEIIEPLTKKP